MNIVALVGNLASEPELKKTTGNRSVCTFRLAVSRVSGEQADFFTVVAWERQAEVCKEYLTLGRRVAVEGRLHHSTWEVEEGRRSKVEVVAHRVELLGKRPRTDEESADDAATAAALADPTSAGDPFAIDVEPVLQPA
jgi:single-strand DNA-binding protein